MIAYDYDSNAILAEPMTSRTGPALLAAYKCIHQPLTLHGLRPKLQRLDNEASTALKQYMLDEGVDFQLTPAGTHRHNAAERAIRTLKNHFIAILCSPDPEFSLHLWDRLSPQALTTLNLLRGSRINPKLSAYAQLNGAFDFNRTPMGPPGTRVLVHELPEARGTWAPHAVPRWYIGPAFEHYRCYRVYITKTANERIANTHVWYPSHVVMPKTSSADAATAAARDLIYASQNPHPAAPIAPLADEHRQGLQTLAELFQQVTTHPKPAPRVRFADDQPNLPTTAGSPRVPPSSTAFTYAGATRNRGQVRRELARQFKQPTVFSPKPVLTNNRFAPFFDDLNQCNRPVAQLARLLDADLKLQRRQHQNRAALDRISTTRAANSAIASNKKLTTCLLSQYHQFFPSQWPTPSLIPIQAHPLNIAT